MWEHQSPARISNWSSHQPKEEGAAALFIMNHNTQLVKRRICIHIVDEPTGSVCITTIVKEFRDGSNGFPNKKTAQY